MEGQWSRRSMVGATLAAVAAPLAIRSAQAAPDMKLDDKALGGVLKQMGLKAEVADKRYDFNFKSMIEEEEWELSMSAVLSQDGSALWIMAWLDELPKSATDVPRTALLRLLSDNDKLGRGKFFAYIAANRRFVLQRVIPNDGLNTTTMRSALDDLGSSVVATYPHWSVANWAVPTDDPANTAKTGVPVKGSAPQGESAAGAAARTVVNDPKSQAPARK